MGGDARKEMRFSGRSSGSLVAAVLALDADVPELFERFVLLLDELNVRRGGWIGAYSGAIRAIVHGAASGKDFSAVNVGGTLSIGTTVFCPAPCLQEIVEYQSSFDLEQSVLASCYIPAVWEEVIWLPGVGPC